MDHEKLIEQFCAVAGTTEDRARFYLESAQWQLPVALSSFFDNPSSPPTATDQEAGMDLDYEPAEPQDDNDTNPFTSYEPPQNALPRSSQGATKNKSKPTRTSKFASIHDFDDEEDKEDEEEGQRFYAGGSEHSGELIVGPPRKKEGNEEIAKSLFREAKKHGAQAVESSGAGKSGDSKPKYFGGGGYRLGENQESSEFIPSENTPVEAEPVNMVLKLWSNGFTVDDGPLRDFKDPANEEFLSSIKKGQIPRELIRNAHGGEVHVDMEDHRDEEYKAPKKKLKPFSGQGHMLGSPTPQFSTNNGATSMKTSQAATSAVTVDKTKPTTTIQIRLSDGKRLKHEFNRTHRISDIRNFIVSSNPDLSSRPFILMTTFPNKELSDETLTLTEAKLLNALVVQKLV